MIADIDKDGSGTIDFDEFLQVRPAGRRLGWVLQRDAASRVWAPPCWQRPCSAARCRSPSCLLAASPRLRRRPPPRPARQMMTAKMGERDSREEILKAFRCVGGLRRRRALARRAWLRRRCPPARRPPRARVPCLLPAPRSLTGSELAAEPNPSLRAQPV